MLHRLLQREPLPIGIEIGTRCLHAAQLLGREHGRQLLTARHELSSDNDPADRSGRAALAAALRKLVRSAPFRGRSVVLALPAEHLTLRHLHLAPMPADDLRAAVHWQLAQQLKREPDTFESDMIDAGEVRESDKPRREIIAAAVDNETVAHYLEPLHEAGLRAEALDMPAAAIGRALSDPLLIPGAGSAPQLALHLGQQINTVAVFEPAQLRFARHLGGAAGQAANPPGQPTGVMPNLPHGIEAVEPAAANTPQALAHALLTSLQYYARRFRQPRPETGVLVGEPPSQPEFIAELSQACGIAFRSPDFAIAAETDPEHGGRWTLAAGLSLYPRDLAALGAAA